MVEISLVYAFLLLNCYNRLKMENRMGARVQEGEETKFAATVIVEVLIPFKHIPDECWPPTNLS
jgi:hypothetical protein